MYFTVILNHDEEFKKVLKKYKIIYKYDCKCIDGIIICEYMFNEEYKLTIKIILGLLHLKSKKMYCKCGSILTVGKLDKHLKSIKHLIFINPL